MGDKGDSQKPGEVDYYLQSDGIDSRREKEIGQHIGYRYDVNLVPDYSLLTPFLEDYIQRMGWEDLNWLEDVHMGYEEGVPGGLRPQYQRLGHRPRGHGIARDTAGAGHDRPRTSDQVPDVAETPPGGTQEGVQEVLILWNAACKDA